MNLIARDWVTDIATFSAAYHWTRDDVRRIPPELYDLYLLRAIESLMGPWGGGIPGISAGRNTSPVQHTQGDSTMAFDDAATRLEKRDGKNRHTLEQVMDEMGRNN